MAAMGKKAFDSLVLVLALMLGVAPVAAGAQALTKDDVIAELQNEGFIVVDTGTTLLGRLRITAMGPEGTREVILNTRNGKVLRDVMIDEVPEVTTEIPRTAVVPPAVTEPPAVEPGAGEEPATSGQLNVDDEGDAALP
jgi:hypothetical protein